VDKIGPERKIRPASYKKQQIQKPIQNLSQNDSSIRPKSSFNFVNISNNPQVQATPVQATPVQDDLFNSVYSRIDNNPQFELEYTKEELGSIYNQGKSLSLDDRVIEDMIFAGSRAKKRKSADQLIEEMDNWVNVVQKQGYPYKFTDKEQFEAFKEDLLKIVEDLGLPHRDVRIQGSSLRNPDANDIDIAVFVSKEKFADLLKAKFDKKIKKNKRELELKSMTFDQLKELAEDIKKHGKEVYNNNVTKNFLYYMKSGLISSKSGVIQNLGDATKKLAGKYENLNVESISVLLLGGKFELKPDMIIT
jgi:hypothetical protein